MRLACRGMSSNRTGVRSALISAFLFAMACSSLAMAATRNVVLIIADDQGLDVGVYGNPVLRTPNLDRLAARGTLFTNAFATVSSCSPSRSVIRPRRRGM
jgi:N-sulfoglucosamine sulfohydrolase